MNACPCSKYSFLVATMGCHLACHFSGLWASLMSTLIPLRSGAGVYATLEKKEKNKPTSILCARPLGCGVRWSGQGSGNLILSFRPQLTTERSKPLCPVTGQLAGQTDRLWRVRTGDGTHTMDRVTEGTTNKHKWCWRMLTVSAQCLRFCSPRWYQQHIILLD